MSARNARFRQIEVERAIKGARKVYGCDVPIAFERDGRIVILTPGDAARPGNSFD